MSAFKLYSRYYDLLYAKKSYQDECDYVLGLANAGKGPIRALELGCGTGGHAECMALAGHSVSGIDMSETMLERAAARRARLVPEISGRMSFAPGDVRSWRGDGTFDAVFSLFHVMSYQTSNDDLQAAFETAAAHLAPGGRFVFDYWFGPGVLTLQPSVRVLRVGNDDVRITRLAEPESDPTRNLVTVNYEIQIEETGGERQIVRESHPMRYLFIPEIEFVSRTWFRPVSHSAWMTDRPAGTGDWAGVSVLERL